MGKPLPGKLGRKVTSPPDGVKEACSDWGLLRSLRRAIEQAGGGHSGRRSFAPAKRTDIVVRFDNVTRPGGNTVHILYEPNISASHER